MVVPTEQQSSLSGAYKEYVALGDSYSAAGGIPVTEVTSSCFRSDHNYPQLLATRLKVTTFRDVTCGGAETADVLRSTALLEKTSPAQLDAVSRTTDLVTVGIGANDFAFIVGLLTDKHDQLPAVVPVIGARVADVLAAAHRKAPRATVVMVGYPRLFDPKVACPEQTSLTLDQIDKTYRVGKMLDDELRRAANLTGSVFVELFAASEGHGICAKTPWVNGMHLRPNEAVGYHPFAREQEAAAELITKALEGVDR